MMIVALPFARVVARAATMCFAICFQLLIAYGVPGLANECLRIDGTLAYSTPPDPRVPTNEERYSFRLLLDERAWNIQMIPVDAEKRAIKYFEIGCDGEALYAYHEQNLDLIPPKLTNGVAVVPTTRGFAMIIPDTLPTPRYFRCEPLWLAYCSYSYFSTNFSGQARQIWLSGELSPSAVLDNILVKATWNWLPKGRRYLSHVDYYARPDSIGSTPLPLVVYNVTQTQELEGVDVPTAFSFVRFSELDLSSRTPFVTFSCRATNVLRVQHLSDPKTKISVPVMMIDYRFSTETPPVPMLQQIVTDGSWPEKAAVASSKQLRIAKRIILGQASAVKKPFKRTLVIGIILANATVLSVATAMYYRNRNKTKNRKDET